MARCGRLVVAALFFVLCESGQSEHAGTCAAEGRCRPEVSSESPVSLLQTFTSGTTKNGAKTDASRSLSAVPPMVALAQQEQAQKTTTSKREPSYLATATMCFFGATMAGIIQAILAVYNAITFHCVCAIASWSLTTVQVGVNQATLYIMLYQPIMDLIQVYNFRDAKRNWPFILSYGFPFFFGLFGGLGALYLAMKNAVAFWLEAFLLFSCVMVICNESYTRIKMMKAAMQSATTESDLSNSGKQSPEDAYEEKPQDKRGAGPQSPREIKAAERKRLGEDKIPQGSAPAESIAMESSSQEPAPVDMSHSFTWGFTMLCGLMAGFGAGAISIAGTFVLLMLNTLNISVPEWKATQCVAEVPCHLIRTIIVLALGIVNWSEDWMNVVGVLGGTGVGLIIGNKVSNYVPLPFLRAIVFLGICATVVLLVAGMFK